MKRKPIKIMWTYVTDGNFNIKKFTHKQAISWANKEKKRLERQFTNGFKFKKADVIEKDEYFAISIY